MSDPFLDSLETAESVSEKVNILVYGPPAVGKTFSQVVGLMMVKKF